MSTSVFTNGIRSPRSSLPRVQPSTIASDRPALALAAELPALLLKIVGDHDEHPEGPAEQDAGDHVAQLEQPEPAVVEEAHVAQPGLPPSERLVREVQPVRGD